MNLPLLCVVLGALALYHFRRRILLGAFPFVYAIRQAITAPSRNRRAQEAKAIREAEVAARVVIAPVPLAFAKCEWVTPSGITPATIQQDPRVIDFTFHNEPGELPSGSFTVVDDEAADWLIQTLEVPIHD